MTLFTKAPLNPTINQLDILSATDQAVTNPVDQVDLGLMDRTVDQEAMDHLEVALELAVETLTVE